MFERSPLRRSALSLDTQAPQPHAFFSASPEERPAEIPAGPLGDAVRAALSVRGETELDPLDRLLKLSKPRAAYSLAEALLASEYIKLLPPGQQPALNQLLHQKTAAVQQHNTNASAAADSPFVLKRAPLPEPCRVLLDFSPLWPQLLKARTPLLAPDLADSALAYLEALYQQCLEQEVSRLASPEARAQFWLALHRTPPQSWPEALLRLGGRYKPLPTDQNKPDWWHDQVQSQINDNRRAYLPLRGRLVQIEQVGLEGIRLEDLANERPSGLASDQALAPSTDPQHLLSWHLLSWSELAEMQIDWLCITG